MARVIVSVSSQAAFPHRQPGLGAVQGLNLALLVHTQHQGLVGRIEIKPDHVAELGHKGAIAAELEGLGQVRFEAVLPPDPPDSGLAQALGCSHGARAPVGRVGRKLMQGRVNHRRNLVRRDLGDPARPGCILFQTWQAQRQKSLPPQLHRRSGNLQRLRDLLTEHPIGRHPDDLSPLHQALGQPLAARPRLQSLPFSGRQHDRFGFPAHPSQAYPTMENK